MIQMNESLKEMIEGFSGAPVGIPSDELNTYIEAVANVVYDDGVLNFEEFKSTINNFVDMCPKCWRKGQAVFNMVDAIFGVAREVQFELGIDPFYNDDVIDKFIEFSYERYWSRIIKDMEK